MRDSISRRRFIQSTSAAGLGMATMDLSAIPRISPNSRVNVLSIGVVGSIGGTDRSQVASHPAVQITGLCDVDRFYLEDTKLKHPDAFVCSDYREAFDQHGDKFDAVIVSTPDHTHAPIMLTALAAGKHVYGQKPLVHQLEELAWGTHGVM